ncbi:MAG: glucoamylase [Dehalococcoidia bacterium]|nr:glucoamylase [Dehalococcoidia bacterium]
MTQFAHANIPHEDTTAFGAPGIEPRWTSSAKDGVGTAYHSASCIWFTLSHGIINEIYFPHVDSPNTRDLQFLITDGESFCHEERRDLIHQLEYPDQDALFYRLTNSDPAGGYRLVKEIVGDPHSSVLLMHTRLEVLDPKLSGKLRLYALLAPHMKGTGRNNSAWWCDLNGRRLFDVQREDVHMSFGCTPDFTRRSVGYVGFSDGWQDLMDNFKMDWQFEQAEDGNIALTGEIDLSEGMEFTLGVGFGTSRHSASSHLLQAFATPFADQRARYIDQWQRTRAEVNLDAHTRDGASLARVSQSVLLAHEDKICQGAFVASLSIPWGDTKDDSDRGGYHLVWTRDMVQTATALLACGQTESPLRALIWLASIQADDGSLPQNSSIEGEAYWKGIQLDQVAVPILLAWRLQQADALRQFDPWTLISRSARYLVLRGPVTAQERWEENSGYSPSTLAAVVAGLVCAAEFARGRKDKLAADFLLDYADWLSSHLEEWMVTTRGELVKGKPRHYVRITPADPNQPLAWPDPDEAELFVGNGGGKHPARNIVGGDFLQLVRLGVRAADDPLVVDSVAVIDQVLKRDLPQGPCWRRYNHDGYGQKADGCAYDGTGEGRSWPLLTGERGHYELAARRDPLPFIEAMEQFANEGGMLPEQVWDADDLPEGKMKRGGPTGSAMPLCWAHAEYVSLVRSHKDGVSFDRIEPVYQRYVEAVTGSKTEMWTFAHQPQGIAEGKKLRIITEKPATVHWSFDGWATAQDLETRDAGFGCWFGDLPSDGLAAGARIAFTFLWQTGWERKDFEVRIEASIPIRRPA